MEIGRNDPCPCGSVKNHADCCLRQDETRQAHDAPHDKDFSIELRPDVDDAVDRVLRRLERGEGKLVRSKVTQLLERHPDYHMTNYAMGVFHAFVSEDLKEAIPFFERAIAIYPMFAAAHFNLGMASRQAYQVVNSIQAFRAAERYSENNEIAVLARKELQWFEEVLLKDGVFPSLDAYIANAKLFDSAFERLSSRDFQGAVDLFQQVLRNNPKHVQSYGNMGLAYAGLGRRRDALACLDRALELDPDYEPALLNRRLIAEMEEGKPKSPDAIMEVNYYSDRLNSQREDRDLESP